MIINQSIELLHDSERSLEFVFLAQDAQAVQSYQIPLIDAYVGAKDYLPGAHFIVVPCQMKMSGILFKDTHFISIHDIQSPDAVILDAHVFNAVFYDMRGFTRERNVLSCCVNTENISKFFEKFPLQLIGIPEIDPPHHQSQI